MQLLSGLVLLVGGILTLLAARPKQGRPRFFVGTGLETPVVISVIMAMGVGTVLTVAGIAELFE
jgi:hypothetical protein